jgi:hypothetical protein
MLTQYLTIEGVLALGLSFGIYTVSLASRGKQSLAHSLFYNQLRLLSPTKESVAFLAGVTKQRAPKTMEERLSALELSSRTVTGGMVAVGAMKTKETAVMWKNLEDACSLVLGCIVAFILRWILLWAKVFYKPCCSNLDCWKDWFIAEDNAKPILVVLFLLTWHSVSHLGKHTSKLPPGSPLRYSPSSYITGWIFGLATLTPLTPRHLPDALEELAARVLLFNRLLGIRVDNEQALLVTMTTGAQFAVALLAGFVGFVIAEPVSSSIQLLVYRWFSFSKTDLQKQRMVRAAMLLATLLPVFILLACATDWRSFQIVMSWIWIASLYCLTKPLLQTYLDRSLPDAKQVLESKSDLTSDKIFHPFKHRYSRLVENGIKLSVLPSTLVILLSLTSLCNSSTTGIYPIGYAGPMSSSVANVYLETRALTVTNSVVNQTSLLGINTCGTPPLPPRRKHGKKDAVVPPTIERGSDLLENVPAVPMTIAGALGNLQSSQEDEEEKRRDDDGDDDGTTKDIFASILQHPFVTSTVARPILDLLTLLVTAWWLVSLAYGLIFSHKTRQEIGTYSFDVEQSQKAEQNQKAQ